jgi:diacylglycerol kinase family enzyme
MPLVSHALFVVPPTESPRLERIRQFASEHRVRLIEVDQAAFFAAPERLIDQAEHVLALVGDEHMAELVNLAKTLNFSLGIVPLEDQPRLQDWFRFPAQPDEAIELALGDKPMAIDVLRCNNQVALGSVMLGKTPFLDSRSRTYRMRQQSWQRRLLYSLALLWSSLRSLFGIHPFAVTLTTGREQTLKTAITGLVAIENNVNNAAAKLIGSGVSVLDGKVSTVLIAPKSVIEYLAFLFLAIMRGEKQATKLPKAISYIRSSYLRIDGNQPLTYFIDGRKHLAASIELELYPQAVRVNLCSDYQASQGSVTSKDSLKIDNLPQKDERLRMI